MLQLYNTLSGKVEEFIPLDSSNIRMYVCGPTLYSRVHLGNIRSIVVYDILYRVLNLYYPDAVTYVRNITDVDDKICDAAAERNISCEELVKEMEGYFIDDLNKLFLISPTKEPKATHYIENIQAMISSLLEKNMAYISNDQILFAVNKFHQYGHLSRRQNIEEQVEYSSGRELQFQSDKRSQKDFVLWKLSKENEVGWKNSWFKEPGRPGWHIECAVMATEILGTNFDIHGGGVDLKFPHHENEIALSCCNHENTHYAKYWVHNGFLKVENRKMSKSLGNFLTLENLEEHNGEVIKYALLSAHYLQPLNWTEQTLKNAQKFLYDTYQLVFSIMDDKEVHRSKYISYDDEFLNSLNDNINIAKVHAYLHAKKNYIQKLKNENVEKDILFLHTYKLCRSLRFLGFMNFTEDEWKSKFEIASLKNEAKSNNVLSDSEIEKLIQTRLEGKKNKNFARADEIRTQLLDYDIEIQDLPNNQCKWRRK